MCLIVNYRFLKRHNTFQPNSNGNFLMNNYLRVLLPPDLEVFGNSLNIERGERMWAFICRACT